MTHRLRPRDRRTLVTFDFRFDNHGFTIGIGRDLINAQTGEVGPVNEMFLKAEKVDSMADALASDVAILISLLLQYRCPAATIAAALKRDAAGVPATLVGFVADLVQAASQEVPSPRMDLKPSN
jgi:hypothetical protein